MFIKTLVGNINVNNEVLFSSIVGNNGFCGMINRLSLTEAQIMGVEKDCQDSRNLLADLTLAGFTVHCKED